MADVKRVEVSPVPAPPPVVEIHIVLTGQEAQYLMSVLGKVKYGWGKTDQIYDALYSAGVRYDLSPSGSVSFGYSEQ